MYPSSLLRCWTKSWVEPGDRAKAYLLQHLALKDSYMTSTLVWFVFLILYNMHKVYIHYVNVGDFALDLFSY